MKMTGMQAEVKYGTGQYEIEDTSDINGKHTFVCMCVCVCNCNGAIETLSPLSDALKQSSIIMFIRYLNSILHFHR
jgi:hypothetical protein